MFWSPHSLALVDFKEKNYEIFSNPGIIFLTQQTANCRSDLTYSSYKEIFFLNYMQNSNMHFDSVWQNKYVIILHQGITTWSSGEKLLVYPIFKKKGGTSLGNADVIPRKQHSGSLTQPLCLYCRNTHLLISFPFSWTWHSNSKYTFWVQSHSLLYDKAPFVYNRNIGRTADRDYEVMSLI